MFLHEHFYSWNYNHFLQLAFETEPKHVCISRLVSPATDGDLNVADGRATGPHNLPHRDQNHTNPLHLTWAEGTVTANQTIWANQSEGGRGKPAMSMLSIALGSETAAFNCSGGREREGESAWVSLYTHMHRNFITPCEFICTELVPLFLWVVLGLSDWSSWSIWERLDGRTSR